VLKPTSTLTNKKIVAPRWISQFNYLDVQNKSLNFFCKHGKHKHHNTFANNIFNQKSIMQVCGNMHDQQLDFIHHNILGLGLPTTTCGSFLNAACFVCEFLAVASKSIPSQ
jgi:hypothetical protein